MKKYNVTLDDFTIYAKTIEAENKEAAIEEAQRIWEEIGPEEFEIVGGSTDDWECQEID